MADNLKFLIIEILIFVSGHNLILLHLYNKFKIRSHENDSHSKNNDPKLSKIKS